jgi:hypothetical protein
LPGSCTRSTPSREPPRSRGRQRRRAAGAHLAQLAHRDRDLIRASTGSATASTRAINNRAGPTAGTYHSYVDSSLHSNPNRHRRPGNSSSSARRKARSRCGESEARAYLRRRGVECSDVDEQPWGWFVRFDNTDGNRWAPQQVIVPS